MNNAVIRVPSPAAATYCVLLGFPILRVERHRGDPRRAVFVFASEAQGAVDDYFRVFNAMMRKANHDLLTLTGSTNINHTHTPGKAHDHGSDEQQPERHQ